MLSVRLIGCMLVSAVALAGCGAPMAGGRPGPVAGINAAGPDQRLTALTRLDDRVARVAWRLSQANADLCPVVRQSAGWALHAAGQYSPEVRPHAQARFALDGDLPGVLSAPEGSPAELAGLRPGDLIISVNGQPLVAGGARRAARFEGLAANVARLDAALASGPADLIVRRDGQTLPFRIQPVRACGYDVQLNPSDDLNARADGRRLFISTALAGFSQSDDELALILGHELAHNVLRHRSWAETGGEGRTVIEGDCDPALCRGGDPERQADRVGLYLAARAGFDPSVAAPFWRRFGASNWRVRYPALAHASAGVRAIRLEAVQAEIAARVAAGQPLTP
jgi:PDZ domain/Peptidase family M48